MSMDFALYKEVVDRVRDNCDMVINLTTGAGGGMGIDSNTKTGDISKLKTGDERVEHILKLKPELRGKADRYFFSWMVGL